VTATIPHQVRIIGGAWKRTPLPVADIAGLRPTPDRVRETLFNWLTHLVDLQTVRGLDLFAGTGALGFELASRGARQVTLVEQNSALLAQLQRTRSKLEATQVEVLAGDALAVARRWPDASFDLVLLDPPFDTGLLAPALAAGARLARPAAGLRGDGEPLDGRPGRARPGARPGGSRGQGTFPFAAACFSMNNPRPAGLGVKRWSSRCIRERSIR
jgi:16S rRNA (guanine(966)-N(2))-methyltransferase RsmD